MTTNPQLARTSDSVATVTLRHSGDVVEAIPYLVGFHPERSVVLVALDRARVVVTVRFDIDAMSDDEVLADVAAVLGRSEVTGIVLAIFDDGAGPPRAGAGLPHSELVDRIARQLSGLVDVLEMLLVGRTRWCSYIEYTPECSCCVEGTPIDRAGSAAAAATYAGLVAFPSRADLEAVVAPGPDADHVRLRPLLERAQRERDRLGSEGLARWRLSRKRSTFAAARDADSALLPIPALRPPDHANTARIGVALSDIEVRDAVWLAIDQRRLDGRLLWQWLARTLPDDYRATPLFLFGWCAWRDGNGALAGVAAEQVLAVDAHCSAADLLLGAVRHGLDPFRTPRLRRSRGR